MSGSDAANLARIRDNQRRSRARRKEYLQEIEGRLRECEQTGVEASTEIQAAARRVAEENRRLRLLLIQHGVGIEEINTFVSEQDFTSQASEHWAASEKAKSDDAAILEGLLALGRRCCGRPSTGSIEQPQLQPVSADIDTSSRMIPRLATTTNNWTSSPSGSMQYAVSTMASAASTPIAMSPHNAQFPAHLQQASHIQHQPIYPMPILASQYRDTEPQNTQQLQPQHQNLTAVQPFQQQQAPAMPLMNYAPPPMESQQQNFAQPMSVGTNSCVYATEMITSIATNVHPGDVRTDLGCSTSADCEVDNRTVFDVMDRYSGVR